MGHYPTKVKALKLSGLEYEIYSGGGPSTYVYCVVCYHVIVAPYVRSVGHVFAYLYTLDVTRNALWTMRLIYSLKYFLGSKGFAIFQIQIGKSCQNTFLTAKT